MESLGEKIKRIRQSKGISQTVVADACGIKQSSYANIESGKTQTITIEVGKGIARALNIPFIELFEIESPVRNIEIIEKLTLENENLKKQIEEKTLLIEMLKNERLQIKEFLISQMVESYSFEIKLIEDQISRALSEEEKGKLIQKKENVVRFYNNNKDRYLRSSFVSQTDFINYFNEMRGLVSNLPEEL